MLSILRSYPVLVNLLPGYTRVADSFWTTEIGVANAHTNDTERQIELTGDGVLAKNETPAPTEAADGGRAQDESQVEDNGQPDDSGVAENQDDGRTQPASVVQDNGQREYVGVAASQVEGIRRSSSHYSTATNGNPKPSPEDRAAMNREGTTDDSGVDLSGNTIPVPDDESQVGSSVLRPLDEPGIWQRIQAQLARGPFVKILYEEVEEQATSG
jgi:hypothetical protein